MEYKERIARMKRVQPIIEERDKIKAQKESLSSEVYRNKLRDVCSKGWREYWKPI